VLKVGSYKPERMTSISGFEVELCISDLGCLPPCLWGPSQCRIEPEIGKEKEPAWKRGLSNVRDRPRCG
jgi:hypothetical protein